MSNTPTSQFAEYLTQFKLKTRVKATPIPVPAKGAVKGAGGSGGKGDGGGRKRQKEGDVIKRDETPSRFGGVISGIDVVEFLQVSLFSFRPSPIFPFHRNCCRCWPRIGRGSKKRPVHPAASSEFLRISRMGVLLYTTKQQRITRCKFGFFWIFPDIANLDGGHQGLSDTIY